MRHDDEMILRPADYFRMDLPDFFRADARENPVRFRFGMQRVFELNVQLPSNWELKTEARSDSLKSPYGEAFWNWKEEDGDLRIRMGYSLAGNDIPSEKYHAFLEFLESVRTYQIRELILQRKKNPFP
jgi:hypothetical protein